ncbi:MAG: glutaredoxin family protein [Actinomycetota bacterium]
MSEIKVYGADWCGDCRRAKRMLDNMDAAYEYIDVDVDLDAKTEAIRISGRKRIPVIVFPEGDVLVEPTDPELKQALLRRSA